MLACHLYRHGSFVDTVSIDRVNDTLEADEDARVWIDAHAPDQDDLAALEGIVELHPLTIEDALHWRQRSKIEFFERYFTVVLHAMELGDGDELIDREIHAFVLPRILVTLRQNPGDRPHEALERLRTHHELAARGPAAFLYVMLDLVIDDYLSIAERFEDASDRLEDRVFADTSGTAVQQELFEVKRKVTVFRRTVAPMREIIDLIRDQPDFATADIAPYYRDLLDHVLRTLEFTDNVRDLLQSALEAQLAQVSNRTNVIMKRVTSWGSILLVPTLISGIYGMNFRHMPELDWRFGYPMALVLMGVASFLLHRMFRRRDWL